jgi:K+-transporting ATPase ATPase C chain
MRELRTAVIAIVVMTVLLGLAYPLAMTGISQVAFGDKADGDTTLLARPWVIDTGKKDADGEAITTPDPKYFQPRPSATGYAADATFFSNRGPNSAAARYFYRDGLKAYIDPG